MSAAESAGAESAFGDGSGGAGEEEAGGAKARLPHGNGEGGGESQREGGDAVSESARVQVRGIGGGHAAKAGVVPVKIEEQSEGEKVAEVEILTYGVDEEMAHHAGREGQEGNEHQEDEVDPAEGAADVTDKMKSEVVEQPEGGGDEEGADEAEEGWGFVEELAEHIGVGGVMVEGGDFEFEDEKGHGDGEDAVTESFDAGLGKGERSWHSVS